jgi:SAM-dependent methyltransferase
VDAWSKPSSQGLPDVRWLNWRFVVPDEPQGLLLLPVGHERVPGAVVPEDVGGSLPDVLSPRRFPAIVAADLHPWFSLVGGPLRLVETLADSVRPGGWLYVGWANPLHPSRARSLGVATTASRVEQTLRRHGYSDVRRYLAFPHHRCPAYLVRAGGAELDYFLRRLAFPYADAKHRHAHPWRVRARAGALAAAIAAPDFLRVPLAPAFSIMAIRGT